MEDIKSYAEISSEILAMAEADQDMRQRAIENGGIIEGDKDSNIDKNNTERMKQIVAQIGWPTASKVGRDASVASWLLVQHADHDPDFQEECLALMKECSPEDVRPVDIAMLTDRICVNRKQPQIYGTQFQQIEGKHIPREISDPEHVNQRRQSIGLDTLEENIERMYKKYPTP
jgi:hypothetical protein